MRIEEQSGDVDEGLSAEIPRPRLACSSRESEREVLTVGESCDLRIQGRRRLYAQD